MRRLPLELIERLRALRPTPDRPLDHVGFVATAAGLYFLIASVIEVWRFLVADIIRPVWTVVRPWILAVLLLLLTATPSMAVEAACVAMGAKCHCASALDAPSWIRDGPGGDLLRASNENVSDAKLCGNVTSGGHRYEVSTNATVSATTGLNGTTAMFDPSTAGATNVWPISEGSLSGRVGARYYMKHSTDYGSTDSDGTPCNNDKYTQIGDYFTAFTHRFTASSGGTMGGAGGLWAPGNDTSEGPVVDLRGNWLMVEHYIQNYSTSATTHEYYLRNLTNGQERSFSSGSNLSNIQISGATNVVHHYRDGQPTCAGSLTMQYALMATGLSANERIPAASELEGGAPASRGFILRMMVPLLTALVVAAWRAKMVS